MEVSKCPAIICPSCGNTVDKVSHPRTLHGALLLIPLLLTSQESFLEAFKQAGVLHHEDELFSYSSPPSLTCCKNCYNYSIKALKAAQLFHPMRMVLHQSFGRPALGSWVEGAPCLLVSASGDTLRTIYKKIATGSIELMFDSDDGLQTATEQVMPPTHPSIHPSIHQSINHQPIITLLHPNHLGVPLQTSSHS